MKLLDKLYNYEIKQIEKHVKKYEEDQRFIYKAEAILFAITWIGISLLQYLFLVK
jgi:hypothetical protein